MVAVLRRLGLPADNSDPDYLELAPLDVISKHILVKLYKDRVVTKFTFDGAYNKGKLNPGIAVDFEVAYFFEDDGDKPRDFWHRLGLKAALAAHSLAIDLLMGKRRCGSIHEDHAERVKSLLMWAPNNGSVPFVNHISDKTGCCGFGNYLDNHFKLLRRDVVNSRLYGEQKFVNDDIQTKRTLIFEVPKSTVEAVFKAATICFVP